MSSKVILLDLHGVLANLVEESIKVHCAPTRHDATLEYDYWRKWPSNTHKGEKMTDEEFWSVCSGYEFWSNIEPYPWAVELYRSLCKLSPVKIVTRPRYDDVGCIPAAIHWCERYLSCPREDVIPIHDKSLLSYEDHILIDDSDENVDAFNAGYGGLAVRFPQPWNSSYLFGWTAVIDVAHRFKTEEQSIRRINDKLRIASSKIDPESLHSKLMRGE